MAMNIALGFVRNASRLAEELLPNTSSEFRVEFLLKSIKYVVYLVFINLNKKK
jgi:hypothetical protein